MRGFRPRRYQPRKKVQPKRQKVPASPVPSRYYLLPKNQTPSQAGQFPPPTIGQQKLFLSEYGLPPPFLVQPPPPPLPPPPSQPIIEQEVSWPATVRLDDATIQREDDFQAFPQYEKIQPKRRRPLTKVEKGVLAFCAGIVVLFGISTLLHLFVLPAQGTQDIFQTPAVSGTMNISMPSSPPTPTPIPDNHSSLGQTLTGDGWQITINSVQESTGDGTVKPKSGDRLLVLNVTAKYVASDPATMFDLHFTLLDSPSIGNDVALEPGYDQVFLSNILSFYDAFPADNSKIFYGQSFQGDIVFEVPLGKHGFDLYYWQSFSDDIDKLGWYIPM